MPDDPFSELAGILESEEHTHLADVGGNTEGPLWHPDGYLTFVSLTESRLYRWDEQNEITGVLILILDVIHHVKMSRN